MENKKQPAQIKRKTLNFPDIEGNSSKTTLSTEFLTADPINSLGDLSIQIFSSGFPTALSTDRQPFLADAGTTHEMRCRIELKIIST